jgi:phosphopantothenoylcysteine decarboxylase/phosphopantothenate--cysteine ligase
VLRGKKILIGVTAGIAAYKIPSLVRILKKAGALVQVVQTPASLGFVSPVVLSTLSGNTCPSKFYSEEGEWNNHVELALWADLILIAPLTANTLAKMAHGFCDNLVLATYLSAKCPVFFAPAMDLDMYAHPTTRENINRLKSFGNIEIPAEKGFLASGLEGEGRMAEPETIYTSLLGHFSNGFLNGKKILINAGPTYEAIDPVRFIGNRSSGRMGIALAEKAALAGAEVELVLGPSVIPIENPNIRVHRVESAQEMYDHCTRLFPEMDAAILSAAVADFKVTNASDQKIKKEDGADSISLTLNPDILKTLGSIKEKQILIGFALETNDELENAKKKIKKKNLDYIVLNSLNDKGAGFGHITNKIQIIDKENKIYDFELKTKTELASDILNTVFHHES